MERNLAITKSLQGLHTYESDKEYFALTLLGTDDGKLSWYVQSRWFGRSTNRRGWEIREPCPVDPDKMAALWQSIGQPFVFASNDLHLAVFLRIGGNAIIAVDIAHARMPEFFRRTEVAREPLAGYRVAHSLSAAELKRAPSRAVRMRVLERDGFRCRLCGASPDDDVHVRLEAHHTRPWGEGGLTNEANLVTLCNTCHEGLEPHSMLEYAFPNDSLEEASSEFAEGVRYYREKVARAFEAQADA